MCMPIQTRLRSETVSENKNKVGGANVTVRHARSATTMNDLVAACSRWDIDYEESQVFIHLRGVVVTCGRSSVISVRASLPKADKLFTLAHELGHVALGHTATSTFEYQFEPGDASLPPGDEKDREASVWAAHLLVRPEVFEAALREAQAEYHNGTRARTEAIARTAQRLGIPLYAVNLWLETKDQTFIEEPSAWLAGPSTRV